MIDGWSIYAAHYGGVRRNIHGVKLEDIGRIEGIRRFSKICGDRSIAIAEGLQNYPVTI